MSTLIGPRHVAIMLCLLLGGCGTLAGNPEEDEGGDGGGGGGATTAKVAVVNFSITDAPLDDAAHVNVTIDSVEVSLAGETWIKVPLVAAVKVDLLALQDGTAAALGTTTDLPLGTYQQTRLRLAADSSPTIELKDGTVETLQIPSGEAQGIRILSPFVVDGTHPVNLTIDFDLRKSIKHVGGNGNGNGNGNSRYMMRPVLRLVENDATGSISGPADSATVVCVFPAGAAKDDTADCDKAVNSAKPKKDRFKAAFLPAGAYDVRIFLSDGTFRDFDSLTVAKGADTALP